MSTQVFNNTKKMRSKVFGYQQPHWTYIKMNTNNHKNDFIPFTGFLKGRILVQITLNSTVFAKRYCLIE